ncbi:uncharacterized protein LOC141818588, partial [Curcuma longa]|uniref:uncharacterized protein LOC141818588 n=1 Tax=Curcuma longa TaxID=136217 RepID=UPI003D9ED334
MEALRKLERVQSLLSLMEGRGISSGHADADRFLADFIFFLVKPCGIVTMDAKLKIISEFLPKISPKILDEVFLFANEEDCQQIDTELPLQSSLQKSLDTQESKFEETPMIGLDAMKRANSTLEDF